MLDKLRNICYFLRVIDEEPRLDLPDLAFMIILGKILFASSVDWTAMVTLALAAMNTMHNRQMKVKTQSIQDMSDQIQSLEDKISPVLDKVKTVI